MNTKRQLLGLFAASVYSMTGCASQPAAKDRNLSDEDKKLQHKFRGIYGVVLRLDALTRKDYTTTTSDKGILISQDAHLGPGGATNLTFTDNSSMPIPKTIRATWRANPNRDISLRDSRWQGGTIIGDYTVPVAERIPDELIDYIRKNGGALRIKIRLRDDGIAIGWDIERIIPLKDWKPEYKLPSGISYLLPGGDFMEDIDVEGKITPGWNKPLIGGPPNMADVPK